jgi:hypothetical protein
VVNAAADRLELLTAVQLPIPRSSGELHNWKPIALIVAPELVTEGLKENVYVVVAATAGDDVLIKALRGDNVPVTALADDATNIVDKIENTPTHADIFLNNPR